MAKEPTQTDLDLYNKVRENYTKIEDYTDKELASTIRVLAYKHPPAFEILNFVDAYFELRKRQKK